MAFNSDELEQKLGGDYQTAKRRVAESSEAIGVAPSPEDQGKLGFTPRAFRIKGQLMGQKELDDVDRNIKDVAAHLAKTSGLVNRDEMFNYEQTHLKAMNEFRVQLLQKGLFIDQQLSNQRLKAEESMAIMKGFSDLAEGAGFAFALKNRKGAEPATAAMPGAPKGYGINAPKKPGGF